MQIYEFSAKPPKKPPNSFYFIVILDTNHAIAHSKSHRQLLPWDEGILNQEKLDAIPQEDLHAK